MSDEGSSDGEEHEGEVQDVDLDDADVSARDLPEVAQRGPTLPPPLPATPSWVPSVAPASLAAPPKPRTWLYGAAIVVVALVGAAFVAVFVRRTPAAPKPSVITIPTVDMNDEPDAGP